MEKRATVGKLTTGVSLYEVVGGGVETQSVLNSTDNMVLEKPICLQLV